MTDKSNVEASHHEWCFRKEAFTTSAGVPFCKKSRYAPNMQPLATELYNWLLRSIPSIELQTRTIGPSKNPINNPFTYHASTLSTLIVQAANESHSVAKKLKSLEPLEAEVKRIRLYTELVNNATRFCEAIIKQYLFCTAVPEKIYKTESLGRLVVKRCETCKNTTHKHNMSLIGSLAHRYKLCRLFECAMPAILELNNERNTYNSHAQTHEIKEITPEESGERLETDSHTLLSKLVHILDHLSALEDLMMDELKSAIRDADNDIFTRYIYLSDKAFEYLK